MVKVPADVAVHVGWATLLTTLVANGAGISDGKIKGVGGVEADGGVWVGGITDRGTELGKWEVRVSDKVSMGGGGGGRWEARVKSAGRDVAVGELKVVEGVDIKGGDVNQAGGTVCGASGEGIKGRVGRGWGEGRVREEKGIVDSWASVEDNSTCSKGVPVLEGTLFLVVRHADRGPYLDKAEGGSR